MITTFPAVESAEKVAEELVDKNLAACVQIIPRITSIFVWNGETVKETEVMLIAKTLADKTSDVEAFIKSRHEYEVPEIISIGPTHVSDSYLAWLNKSLKS